MTCPCRDCERKGCGSYHSHCEKFTEWQEWKAEGNKRRQADKETRQLSRDHELKYRRNLKTGVYK